MEQRININFALPEGESFSYWIRLEQETPQKDTVTPEEAATVIDALFEIDPCEGTVGDTQELQDFVEEDVADAALKRAFQSIDYNPCVYEEGTKDYETKLLVFRSHVDETYNLVLNDGEKGTIETVTTLIDDLVEVTGDTITLDYAVVSSIISAAPIRSINGSTVVFEDKIDGFVRLQYNTEYDKVTISVSEIDGEAVDCECLAFYQELVAELIITPPVEDADAVQVMGCDVEAGSDTDGDDGDDSIRPESVCYRRTVYEKICRCSRTVKDAVSNVSIVPCNSPYASGHIAGAYDSFQEAKKIKDFVACPDEEGEWTDADEYEDVCCEPPPWNWSAPLCQQMTREYQGGSPAPGKNSPEVSYVPVPPPDGLCGTITSIYQVEQKDCCDSEFYEDLDYDEINSVIILADSSSGLIFWDGGFINPSDEHDRSNGTVSVRGSGFWLDSQYTEKDRVFSSGYARIYTDEDACGVCQITISDNCSETTGKIRAAEGRWESQGYVAPSAVGNFVGTEWAGGRVIAYKDEYKYAQQPYTQGATQLHPSNVCDGACLPNHHLYEENSTCTNRYGGTGAWAGWSINGAVSFTMELINSLSTVLEGSEDECGFINANDRPECYPAGSIGYEHPCVPPQCVCASRYGWKLYINRVYIWKWTC